MIQETQVCTFDLLDDRGRIIVRIPLGDAYFRLTSVGVFTATFIGANVTFPGRCASGRFVDGNEARYLPAKSFNLIGEHYNLGDTVTLESVTFEPDWIERKP